MTLYISEEKPITGQQRWGNFIALVVGVLSFVIVLNMRNVIENAQSVYVNDRVGLTAYYPSDWLLDESNSQYVFRVENVQERGFKTSYTVSIQPISANTSLRTIFDILSMQRAQTLAAYRVLSIEDFDQLSGDSVAQSITYTYVATDANPFLEALPVVVVGKDVVTFSRGQAIIITLLSESSQFDANLRQFETFIRELEY